VCSSESLQWLFYFWLWEVECIIKLTCRSKKAPPSPAITLVGEEDADADEAVRVAVDAVVVGDAPPFSLQMIQ
jgi:hypothetical protein